jgi:hypothetical protein
MLQKAMIGKAAYIDKANNLVNTRGRDLHSLTNSPCEITKIFAEQQRANTDVRFEPQRYLAS